MLYKEFEWPMFLFDNSTTPYEYNILVQSNVVFSSRPAGAIFVDSNVQLQYDISCMKGHWSFLLYINCYSRIVGRLLEQSLLLEYVSVVDMKYCVCLIALITYWSIQYVHRHYCIFQEVY